MKANQLMTRRITCCGPDDTLHRAAQLMWENDCGSLPVVDASDGLIGMITDRDACMAAYLKGQALWNIRVDEIMTRDVVSARPDDDVTVIEARMREHQIRRVPIVDDGKVVGLVSLNDLALASQNGDGKRSAVNARELAVTMAGICRHRIDESAMPHAAIVQQAPSTHA